MSRQKYYYGPTPERGAMGQRVYTTPYWGQVAKVTGALCPDGSQRVAYVSGEENTWFSLPANVKVRGKTVTGFLTCDSSPNGVTAVCNVWQFWPITSLKNAALLATHEGQADTAERLYDAGVLDVACEHMCAGWAS